MRLRVLGLLVLLAGCGYDGGYRYECQDPANWEKPECVPPQCKVSGTCTEDIIGFNPNETTIPETVVVP